MNRRLPMANISKVSLSRREIVGVLAIAPLALPRASSALVQERDLISSLPLDGAPGAAVAIISKGRVAAIGGAGTADEQGRMPPDGRTIFEIGSLTKTFTACLIFQLQEQGLLRIERPIGTYVPDLPNTWQDLRLSQLLSHTSGLPEYLDQNNFRSLLPQNLKPRQILSLVADRPMRFAAGERREYNNTGFVLLGMAAEAVTGKNYWDELERRFFVPAGMTSTGPSDRMKRPDRRASGHFWEGEKYEVDPPRSAPGSTWSAGGLLSTARDIARWSIALDRYAILSENVRRQMWTPAHLSNGQPAGWGYGWEIETDGGRTIVAHGGGTAGFSCWYRRDVSRSLSTIVLTNQNGRADPQTMTTALLARMVDG